MMATICGKTMMRKSAAQNVELTCSFFAYLHYSFLMRLCYEDLNQQGALDDTSIHDRVKKTKNPITTAEPDSQILKAHEWLRNLGLGHDPYLYLSTMLNHARQRRFFLSSEKYMGMGPAAMQKGDIICIFYGGRVPYIVRPTAEYYELVGECYAHGLMDGEAIVKNIEPE
jgi:hypothetical protein